MYNVTDVGRINCNATIQANIYYNTRKWPTRCNCVE